MPPQTQRQGSGSFRRTTRSRRRRRRTVRPAGRAAKSGALSHYEDRRERKGWLVEGVHGISIARRNNWVQSGRLPYVTSAPFKRESASSSSSLILIHVPASFHSPHSRAAPDLPPRRQKEQPGMGKKRPEEGDYRAKCTRTRQGRERGGGEEQERNREKASKTDRGGGERQETEERERERGGEDLEEKRSTRGGNRGRRSGRAWYQVRRR